MRSDAGNPAAQTRNVPPQLNEFNSNISTRLFAVAGAIIISIATAPLARAATIFVNAGLATGANSGTSWADAYRTQDGLATAITASVSGDEIWVVAGSYRPTSSGTRTISFNLKTGVGIFGGFNGTETLLSQRNFAANVTRLTGDLAANDGAPGTFINDGENSHHVVNGAGANVTGVLDGFLITGGNANAAADFDRGGGAIFVSASNGTLRNCRLEFNRCTFGGGALYIRQSSPAFSDCLCLGNNGGSFGGACDMATNCNPTFQRCSFISNTAGRAGGVEIFGSSAPNLASCLFMSNHASGANGGGALLIASNSAAIISNCTIVSNSAAVQIGGVFTSSASTSLRNCIIWANTGPGGSMASAQQVTHSGSGSTTLTYCDVMGGLLAGVGNISTDPLFVNLGGGNLRLTISSPCVDTANSSLVTTATDLDGNPRIVDIPSIPNGAAGAVDMGAYELPIPVCAGDIECDGDRDLSDVPPFVVALIDPDNFVGCDIFRADLNGDVRVNGEDIAPFVSLLTSGPCP